MRLVAFFLLLNLASCSGHNLKSYHNENPKINLRNFFNGNIYGQGIVQDRSGQVIKRFNVDIKASWNEDTATLDEKFTYSDNSKSTRIWTLKETKPGHFEGLASDVIGVAKGETEGNVFYFEYKLDLPVGNSNYKVNFEDWMFLLDENTLMARSYMDKWGINLGEVTIIMKKKDLK
jgi:hypothetical protein